MTKTLGDSLHKYIKRHELYVDFIGGLLPLHASLQAFFGISCQLERNAKSFGRNSHYLVNFDTIIIRNIAPADATSGTKIHFPNARAFLIPDEVNWDYYAPIFDMVLSPAEKSFGAGLAAIYDRNNINKNERNMYRKPNIGSCTIAEALSFFNNPSMNDLRIAFEEAYFQKPIERIKSPGELNNSILWFVIQMEDGRYSFVMAPKFVSCLREIAAILANTAEAQTGLCEGCTKACIPCFGYKGKYEYIRRNVLRAIEIKIETAHCKYKGQRNGIDGHYQQLCKDIANWGSDKAKLVISGIEVMARVILEQLEITDK